MVSGLPFPLYQTLPAEGRRHSVLLAVFLDDYHKLLVQRVAAVAARSGIIGRGFIESVYPRFSWFSLSPYPAKLLELVSQFPARIGVNTFRRGKHHLHLGEPAVAAEVGIAAIADVDDILAGDLRNRAGPPARVGLLLTISLRRLRRIAALHGFDFLKRFVNHGAIGCLGLIQAASDKSGVSLSGIGC